MQLSSYVKTAGARINAWRSVPILPTDPEAIVLTIVGDGPLNVTLELSPSDAVQVRAALDRELQRIAASEPAVSQEEVIERG